MTHSHAQSAAMEGLESRLLLSVVRPAPWVIRGDADRSNFDDTIVVRRSESDATMLEAVVNGQVVSTRLEASVRDIRIWAGRGNDTVTIDYVPTERAAPAIVWGGPGNDTITGGAGNDILLGQSGDNVLIGGAGNDRLIGGPGVDRLEGGEGDDLLSGGAGQDVLWGQAGADLLVGGRHKDQLFRDADDRLRPDRTDSVLNRDESSLLAEMESSALRAWLLDQVAGRYADLFGRVFEVAPHWPRWLDMGAPPAGGGLVNVAFGRPDAAAWRESDDHSDTNTQVGGVDEADLVETDGQILYVISGQDVVAFAAWPADQLRELARWRIEGSPQGLYLHEGKLTVVSSTWRWEPTDPIALPFVDRAAPGVAPWYGLYRSQVHSTVLELAAADGDDAAEGEMAFRVVEETAVDGRLVDSRAVGSRVYLVVQNHMRLPEPRLLPFEARGRQWQRYETKAEFQKRLEAMSLDELLPGLEADDQPGTPLIDEALLVGERIFSSDLLSTVTLDSADGVGGALDVTTIFGTGGTVYASGRNLYVSAQSWWNEATEVYKFAMTDEGTELAATGAVKGRLINQFAMDEQVQDGREVLRLATTTSWGSDQANHVFVLQEQGSSLEQVGSIEGLAPGEQIYSVRFMGDRGFVVTFRQVDPLFALDLSDPANPTVAGELKVPGYSAYLHPVGADHLLGFGRDADEAGRIRGLQLSLFDVSDLDSPQQVDVMRFGVDNWGSHSEAEWDHHAFSYFDSHGIVALPVNSWWWSRIDAGFGPDAVGGLAVIRVDTAGGEDALTSLGTVEHDSEVRRSLRIGDYLYSVSQTWVKVNELENPEVQVAAVPLAPSIGDPGDDGPPIVIMV